MKRRNMSKPWVSALFGATWTFLRFLPLPLASGLTAAVMRSFAGTFTRQDLIRDNLAKAFPDWPESRVRKTARAIAGNVGRIAAELCHIEDFRGGAANGRFTYSGEEAVATARKGSVIFVGPHQWNWELVPLLYSELGIRVTTIYGQLANDLVDRTIFAQRARTGATYVEKRKAVRALVNALDKGESLAFLVDQRVKSGLAVKFFGRDMLMTGVPARLALRFRCPIVTVDMERRRGHRFHVRFGKPIHPPPQPGADAEREMTQRIAKELEDSIRRAPETWFCNKRRWPDAPA
jgi:Kdo2-lipid IVA lauroyltransferase/acyltransferase